MEDSISGEATKLLNVLSSALTIADLTLATSLMYAQQTEVRMAEFPHIQAWFSRISQTEVWKKTVPL